jgi:osmotically-inducible protein OsmY
MRASVLAVFGCVAVLSATPTPRAFAVPTQDSTAKSADSTLENRIEASVKKDSTLKNEGIDVDVKGGVATLKGTVTTNAQKSRAEDLARITGITRVDNQITVDPAKPKGVAGTVGEKTKAGIDKGVDGAVKGAQKATQGVEKGAEKSAEGLNKAGSEVTDAAIITDVHNRFVGDDLLKGSDINVDCDKHIVTLKGTVASAAGRERAVQIAKATKGVQSVVDQLTIGPKK